MGVLLGKPFLRFAGTGRLTFRGKRKLVLALILSPGQTLLPRPQVRASPDKSVPCPRSTPLFRRLHGGTVPGLSPVRYPPFSPNTIRRPSEERSSACCPVPTERSFRQPNPQAHPVRLAGLQSELKGRHRRPPGDTAGDDTRPWAANPERPVRLASLPQGDASRRLAVSS
jgi:hypothetical protein